MDSNDVPIIDNRHIPLKDSERLPNNAILLNATFWAAVFVVQQYKLVGFTAHNARNRLQQRMDECQRAKLWDHDHYQYSALMYREAIHYVYGKRLTFDGQ